MARLDLFYNIKHQGPLICLLFVSVAAVSIFYVLPFFHGLLITPTRHIPGPFWARVTRWWEFHMTAKGECNLEYVHLHKRYGPVVRVAPNRYSFNDPVDVKVINELGGKFTKTEFYNPLLPKDPDQQNLFLLQDRNAHKERRRKIANLYSMSATVGYEEAVDKMTRVCMRKLCQFADEEREISLPKFMQYYAFDVIAEITFNTSFNMMENEGDNIGITHDIHKDTTYMAFMGLVPELHPLFSWLTKLVKGERSPLFILSFALAQISKHRETNKKRNIGESYDTFLSKLLHLEAEGKIGMPHLLDSVGSNVVAGSDTTAISLSSLLYYLYTTPRCLTKLREEVRTMTADGRISDPVTFQEAQHMPYLQAVIKEGLRIHSAVGAILPRKVPKGGVTLAGTYFPEGTNVGTSAWALHFNKDIYGPDAGQFRPERWLVGKESNDLKDSMMFAFGSGSRTCIGKNISLLEMTKVVPQIVRTFDFVLEKPKESLKSYCAWFVYPEFKVRVNLREEE